MAESDKLYLRTKGGLIRVDEFIASNQWFDEYCWALHWMGNQLLSMKAFTPVFSSKVNAVDFKTQMDEHWKIIALKVKTKEVIRSAKKYPQINFILLDIDSSHEDNAVPAIQL